MARKAWGWEQLGKEFGLCLFTAQEAPAGGSPELELQVAPGTHFPHPGPTSQQVSLTFQHCDSDIFTTTSMLKNRMIALFKNLMVS